MPPFSHRKSVLLCVCIRLQSYESFTPPLVGARRNQQRTTPTAPATSPTNSRTSVLTFVRYDNEKDDNEAGSSNPTASIRQTPCVRICRYNAEFYDGVVCIGCFREAFEIGSWASFGPQERIYALQDALDRSDTTLKDEMEGAISRQELQDMIAYYRNKK